jgi:hypothetical protein
MDKKRILLVEGKEDEQVIYHLLNRHGLGEITKPGRQQKVSVESEEGVDNLLIAISQRLGRNKELECLGIIIDADTNLDERWQAIRNQFSHFSNVTIPDKPNPAGTIFEIERLNNSVVTVGVWLMPNNQLPGMLEDFIKFLIPDTDQLWNRAKTCVQQIPDESLPFEVKQPAGMTSWQTKAEIHTWLAWQDEPGQPLGLAITKKFLDAKSSYAQTLITWFQQLFGV